MITAEMLVDLERKYAPTVGAAPAVFSPHERTRTDSHNAGGDKMGGDRNGYAEVYARLLDGLDPWMVVELGVFQGVSMAMWCDLFPDSLVFGLDLEFGRFHANSEALVSRGAFTKNKPMLRQWDAYGDDAEVLRDMDPIDLFVDDGPHTADAIRNTLRLVGPLMNRGSVYVVEDFSGGEGLLRQQFPDAHIICAGRLNAALL